MLHELVQGVEVDVREELRRKVADGQAEVSRLRGQALVLWHPVEQPAWAAHLVVGARIMPEHLQCQVEPPWVSDERAELLLQHSLVDGDEEVR
ncbi:hypothetical protein D3C84_1107390 [compost metagenome]